MGRKGKLPPDIGMCAYDDVPQVLFELSGYSEAAITRWEAAVVRSILVSGSHVVGPIGSFHFCHCVPFMQDLGWPMTKTG